MSEVQKKIQQICRDIISEYETSVKNIDTEATQDAASGTRSYGGKVRVVKGKLVENIAHQLIRAAWLKITASLSASSKLTFPVGKYDIPASELYLKSLPSHIDVEKFHANPYKLKQDISVYIDGTFVLSVECKAYTENAMFKRILLDAYIMSSVKPKINFALVQLESQLTGDYAELPKQEQGSVPTHTLQSLFPDLNIQIITLLTGERTIKKPIHKAGFFKPLTEENLHRAIDKLSAILMNSLKKNEIRIE